jgi:predicted dehydrogenase
MGIGIAGCGQIAAMHVRAIRALEHPPVIVAACDRNPDRAAQFARAHGIGRSCADPESLAEDPRINAVFLLLPHNLHGSACTQAMSHGKHVLLEKPIAASMAEARSILELQARSAATLMVANNLVFHPVIERVRGLLAAGELGTITSCEVRSHGWFNYGRASNFRLSRERSGGGALMDTGIHFIYLLRSLFGEVRAIRTFAATALNAEHDFPPEGDDISMSILTFETGVIASMTVSYSTKTPAWERGFPSGWEQDIAIYGSRGSVRVSIPGNTVEMYRQGGAERWEPLAMEKDPQAAYLSSYSREIEHFLACLRGEAEPMREMTAASAARDLQIIEQAYLSAEGA